MVSCETHTKTQFGSPSLVHSFLFNVFSFTLYIGRQTWHLQPEDGWGDPLEMGTEGTVNFN